MNRSRYFNYIEEKLSALAYRIEIRGKLNVLDYNLHSENFYQDLFNTLFDWRLRNLNAMKQNVEAIDLIDDANSIVAQVSATASKTKIESALCKDLSKHSGYSFKYISISKDAARLRDKEYKNPHQLKFNPENDIFDIQTILRVVLHLDIDNLRNICALIKKELSSDMEPQKLETNLATIIGILAKEDWNRETNGYETRDFKIEEKITYNQLDAARTIVNDYKIHVARVDRVYNEFDRQGVNKSKSVLDVIRREYLIHRRNSSCDELFFKILDLVTERIRASTNFTPIPSEELDLCVGILIVDAFIRCKIFKNPAGASNAAS